MDWKLLRSYRNRTKNYIENIIELAGGEIATFSFNDPIRIINPYTGEIRKNLTGHVSPVTAIAYLSKIDILASASIDFTFKLWNVTTGALIKSWTPFNDYALKLIVLPNGNLVSLNFRQSVVILNARDNFEPLITFQITNPRNLVLLNNGFLVVAGERDLNFFDPNDGLNRFSVRTEFNAYSYVRDMILLPNGDFAISGHDENYQPVIEIWSGDIYLLKKTLSTQNINNASSVCTRLVALPNNHLACGAEKGVIIFNLETNEIVKQLFVSNDYVYSNGLALLKSGELASAFTSHINIWGLGGKQLF